MQIKLPVFLSFLFLCMVAAAQTRQPAKTQAAKMPTARPVLTAADLKKIRIIEDSLKVLADVIINDSVQERRKKACYSFIPMFVRALKINNSFYYGFDSIASISKIIPPDSTFRIFTWQLQLRNAYRYFGVIQMKSSTLKIFPLVDVGDTMDLHPQDTLTANNWYGALYYNCLPHVINKKTYYTLFGFERGDAITKRKVLDVLWFTDKKEPRFGAPLFHKKDSSATKILDTLNRFFIEYKWNASPMMNYDPELDLIVYDHLTPPSDRAKGAYFTYVPDGTYEGWKWMNNHWQWVEKIFTFAIDELDNPPIPAPLFGKPATQPVLPK
jgi:hypothetical protein